MYECPSIFSGYHHTLFLTSDKVPLLTPRTVTIGAGSVSSTACGARPFVYHYFTIVLSAFVNLCAAFVRRLRSCAKKRRSCRIEGRSVAVPVRLRSNETTATGASACASNHLHIHQSVTVFAGVPSIWRCRKTKSRALNALARFEHRHGFETELL